MNRYERLGRIDAALDAASKLDGDSFHHPSPDRIKIWYDKAKEICDALEPIVAESDDPLTEPLTGSMIHKIRHHAAERRDANTVSICDHATKGNHESLCAVADIINEARGMDGSKSLVRVVLEEDQPNGEADGRNPKA